MTTYLLHDSALRSPELRHELGEPLMDPVTFIEHDGVRIVVGSWIDEPVLAAKTDVMDEFWNVRELGYDELVRDQSFPEYLIDAELALRALKRARADKVVVPPSFGLLIGDYLRDAGIEVVADHGVWQDRRRHKSPLELEGVERAQRAAETAMVVAAHMLQEAEPVADGRLRFEGEELTAEWIREAMSQAVVSQGAECEEILVHSGDACLSGHDLGTGPILANQSCIVDCYPRDRRTGAYADMTRTFVPGDPSEELLRLHHHCSEALRIALDAVRPGATNAHARVVDYFDSEGFPTLDKHKGQDPLTEGFCHWLGHGVGLECHERPWIGPRPDAFIAGDVVAVEPGLYFKGSGGVRLEDTVLVTDSGIKHFTDPFPYDLSP
jgi:Xaa-Pro aminopeptidase